MLLVAAVGVTVAWNQFVLAASVTALTLIVLRVVARVEKRVRKRS